MIEIVFYGRGGQGAVTASRLLATAASLEGQYIQAFPEFGAERRGAPVRAFCRIDQFPIRRHCQVDAPDCALVFDLEIPNFTAGLKNGGWLIINAKRDVKDYASFGFKLAVLDAKSIAVHHKLGQASFPIVNVPMLGAFSKATQIVKPDSLIEALRLSEDIPSKEENISALLKAYEDVVILSPRQNIDRGG